MYQFIYITELTIRKRGVYETLKKIIYNTKIGRYLVIAICLLAIQKFKRAVYAFNEKKIRPSCYKKNTNTREVFRYYIRLFTVWIGSSLKFSHFFKFYYFAWIDLYVLSKGLTYMYTCVSLILDFHFHIFFHYLYKVYLTVFDMNHLITELCINC